MTETLHPEAVEALAALIADIDASPKVLADWWPGKGTTMMDGKRGPKCKTAAQVVEWLQSA